MTLQIFKDKLWFVFLEELKNRDEQYWHEK